ncbi:hypothetical protein MKW94_009422 [Papaver nudicaule]|uniref:RBR-type E3 ubiquitin transferase n=1 Tax=Papaver nudicaule TaxID=74823 RepID=A0AA41RUD5_PAPNU|nr:hypothetical protein [Papaver nudicaule]
MAEGIDNSDALQVVVDDFYFAVLSVASDDGAEEEDVFPISDEKYAEQLCLQEALMSSVSFGDTSSSSHPRYRKSETGESSSSALKIEDKKMKSSMDANATFGDEISLCQICIEAKPANEMRNCTNRCTHVYCSECIAKHVAAKIQENITRITCPDLDCQATLEPHLCRDIIPGQVFDRWENALCESLILAAHKIYCPFKDCSAMLVNDDDGVTIRETECPHCRRLFCAQCKVPWHSDLDCDEYQELKRGGGGLEDMLLRKLAEKKKWRRCPRCNYYVEKIEGCLHITCRCKYEFCYRCGVKWGQSHGGCQ